MLPNELFYGTDFPVWEDQPLCQQMAQSLIPPVINLNKQFVPKYNKSPVDGRGYQLTIEPQNYVGTCVIASNRNATMISTAAQGGYWCDPSAEEMYGTVRAIEHADPTTLPNQFGVHPTVAARAMIKQGWVIKGKYPASDLRFADPAKALAWENKPPPPLPRGARNKDVYRIRTLDGIARSIMAKRAVVFQVPWAWDKTDQFGRIQNADFGGWHSMAIFGVANSYDANLPGLWFMLMNSFQLGIMRGADHPICSGRGTGLYNFNTLDQLKMLSGFCTSVGPLVKI